MRLLIANDIDETLFLRPDPRAWAERVFWFAREGDVVVVSDEPDPAFVRHVGAVTGVDTDRVRVHVCPPGVHGTRRIDPDALVTPEFVAAVAADLADVDEVVTLFPSAEIDGFVTLLGVRDRVAGVEFLAQGGSELANSKATFRAVATAAGVPIAPGAVCRSPGEGIRALRALRAAGHDVMVKMAHRGAGAGNEMVLRAGADAPAHVGGHHVCVLEPGEETAYVEERWKWASADGRYPVVVEALLDVDASVYAEFVVTDDGVAFSGDGTLAFADRRLVADVTPASTLPARQRRALADGGRALAQAYRALGYRGHLAADAVLTRAGTIAYTEVNARTTTSTHLFELRARVPEATLWQRFTPQTWAPVRAAAFLQAVADAGIAFDPATGRGVLMTMPAAHVPQGGFLYVVAGTRPGDEARFQRVLDDLFAA
ncbi:peptide ligase PGM1-related protein [Pseudonocardia sp.]|uniref:preATP grasp domain-containing protein n=1 Tax=Pseudonocardia sp. TaxID=60912 RepID=UPI003D10F4A9